MAMLQTLLYVLHIAGFVAILIGVVPQLRAKTKRIKSSMLHGVATQLVSGFGLVYVIGARGEESLKYAYVGLKLAVLVVIFGLIFSGRNKERVGAGLIWSIFLLTVLNAGFGSMLTG